jgi:undecaprenyl pyrophosphate synthase
MELLVETIRNEVSTLNKNNIKLRMIGDIQMLPAERKRAPGGVGGNQQQRPESRDGT